MLRLSALVLLACVGVASAACVNESHTLVYGNQISTAFRQFLVSILPPGATIQFDNTLPTISASYLAPYQLVIYAQRSTALSNAEQLAVKAFVENGGNVIGLAGWVADPVTDGAVQQSVFGAFGFAYNLTQCVSASTEVINTANPLTNGVDYLPFLGGWFSTPYTGPGTVSYVISSATIPPGGRVYPSNPALWGGLANSGPVGQTIQLPGGGRMVAWGDEWITLVTANGDGTFTFHDVAANTNGHTVSSGQFWKNAIAWAGNICVPGSQITSDCPGEVAVKPTCSAVTLHSDTNSVGLTFANAATSCGQ